MLQQIIQNVDSRKRQRANCVKRISLTQSGREAKSIKTGVTGKVLELIDFFGSPEYDDIAVSLAVGRQVVVKAVSRLVKSGLVYKH